MCPFPHSLSSWRLRPYKLLCIRRCWQHLAEPVLVTELVVNLMRSCSLFGFLSFFFLFFFFLDEKHDLGICFNCQHSQEYLPKFSGRRVYKQRELVVFNKQVTQQQRPEQLTVTSPDMRVNTGCINSTKGSSSKKDAPQWLTQPPFQTHSVTHVRTGIRTRTSFYSRSDIVL